MQSRAGQMIPVQCLADAKAKKENENGMCDQETSGLGEE